MMNNEYSHNSVKNRMNPSWIIRPPAPADAPPVHALIARCHPLDRNSLYCNLLQCSHFSETSALAEDRDGVCGFVSGYRVPKDQTVLFVWQVAVDVRMRGRRLARALIEDILTRSESPFEKIHTTITKSNQASRAMFHGLAQSLGAAVEEHVLFDRDHHLNGEHDSEYLFVIGPFNNKQGISR